MSIGENKKIALSMLENMSNPKLEAVLDSPG